MANVAVQENISTTGQKSESFDAIGKSEAHSDPWQVPLGGLHAGVHTFREGGPAEGPGLGFSGQSSTEDAALRLRIPCPGATAGLVHCLPFGPESRQIRTGGNQNSLAGSSLGLSESG